jgi:hypothetical protein
MPWSPERYQETDTGLFIITLGPFFCHGQCALCIPRKVVPSTLCVRTSQRTTETNTIGHSALRERQSTRSRHLRHPISRAAAIRIECRANPRGFFCAHCVPRKVIPSSPCMRTEQRTTETNTIGLFALCERERERERACGAASYRVRSENQLQSPLRCRHNLIFDDRWYHHS